MVRICKFLVLIVIIAVPFRNVFTSYLPDALGVVAREIILAVAAYVALQILLLNRGHRLALGRWLRTLDVQLVLLYGMYVLVLCVVFLPRSLALSFVGAATYLAYPMLFGLVLLFYRSDELEHIVRLAAMYVYPIISVGAVLSLTQTSGVLASQELAYGQTAAESALGALRATSFTGSSLHLGLYNAMLLPVVFAYLLISRDESRLNRAWMTGSFLLGCLSLVLSFSRGSWVHATVGMLVVGIIGRRNFGRYIKLVAVVGIAVVVMCVWKADYFAFYTSRFRTIANWANETANVGRIITWKACLGQFADSYYLGYGPASSGNAAGKLGLSTATIGTESSYLKLLIELGFAGFALFALLYGRYLARSVKLMRMLKGQSMYWLTVGMTGALVGLSIEMAIYQSIETQVVQALLWFYLAVVSVLYREAASTAGEPRSIPNQEEKAFHEES